MRTKAAALSGIVLRLSQASLRLDQLSQAAREGNSAAVEAALKEYTHEFNEFRTQLAPLSISRHDHGVIGAVLDQLESQLSRLEKMKANVLTGHSASVEEPLKQVKVALRMVQEKVVEDTR